ncbi:MAG: PHP domain-containing protein [Clostridiaceae bacterium]|nr:PHP domain-containing protein [Clostridiaceae bacterium]
MNNKLGLFLSKITETGGIDLHVHSTASDGSYTPKQVMQLAQINQLKYIALTDHDTIQGCLELIGQYSVLEDFLPEQYSDNRFLSNQNLDGNCLIKRHKTENHKNQNPILIPGVELSVVFEDQEIHLLAYYSGQSIKKIDDFLEKQRVIRGKRNLELIKRIHDLGIPIPKNELDPSPEQPVTGRVKVAKWLVANNYVNSIQQAFDDYLAEGKPAYVPRQGVELEYALQLIEQSNGFPVIAHPHQYGWCENQSLLIEKITKIANLANIGVEAFHSNASLKQQKMIFSLARKLNLPFTAGSDFHGSNKEDHQLYSVNYKPSVF